MIHTCRVFWIEHDNSQCQIWCHEANPWACHHLRHLQTWVNWDFSPNKKIIKINQNLVTLKMENFSYRNPTKYSSGFFYIISTPRYQLANQICEGFLVFLSNTNSSGVNFGKFVRIPAKISWSQKFSNLFIKPVK